MTDHCRYCGSCEDVRHEICFECYQLRKEEYEYEAMLEEREEYKKKYGCDEDE